MNYSQYADSSDLEEICILWYLCGDGTFYSKAAAQSSYL